MTTQTLASPRSLTELIRELPEPMEPQAAPRVWPMVLEMLPAPCRVLNAGAGRGGMSWLLDRAGYDVTSVDIHPDHFIAEGLNCEQADLNRPLEFADDSFDLVLAVEVLEHLENPCQFIREAVRVLRPGGQLIATSPNVASLPSRLLFLRQGLFHYFREDSFRGCYHVTPIFPWVVERCCSTTNAAVNEVRYSRPGWPMKNDVPRHWVRRIRRVFWNSLPNNHLFGEIAAYRIVKDPDRAPLNAVAQHDK